MTTIPLPGTIDPSVTATYDAWNRLIKTTGSSNAGMLFSYDGLGRRISKASWNGSLIGPPRHYYLAGQQVIEERSGSDSHPEVQYVWSLRYVDELVLCDRDTGSGDWPIRWYTSDDANFNVTCAVGPTGSAVARYVYSPYGARSILPPNWTGMPPRVQLDIGHQGLIHDSETGLIYNRARTYHPLMGRFMQRDPAEYVDGINMYLYLYDSPQNAHDPLGLWGPGLRAVHDDIPGEDFNSERELLLQEIQEIMSQLFPHHGPRTRGQPPKLPKQVIRDLQQRLAVLRAEFERLSRMGHSDFPGGDVFDYNLEDNDLLTSPYLDPGRHFLDLAASEYDANIAICRCDRDSFQRAMHRGQDYFSHYDNGFRWDPSHNKWGHIGEMWADDPTAGNNVAKDHFDRAYKWTKGFLEKWCKQCYYDRVN